ncbi:hypothetical protein BKA63DRAFT_527183 [Paraphoma chrysanthemicola]|nr:hypothetical protein BKA63DRAFT_527183 [Paraphoma chrysanthemicola]
MADPISIASGILTLVTFSLKASTSLFQTVRSYNSHARNVRDLRDELEALTLVLTSLNEAAERGEVDFATLKLPLCRCGNACKDFEAIIVKTTQHSNGSKNSFRDWAKLKYMGDDIVGFKNMITGYKSIITIALCDANLRTSVVTANVLNEYQEKIEDTMSDLKEHLSSVNEKLQALLARKSDDTSDSGVQRTELLSEQESLKQCMKICMDVATHIDLVRPKVMPQSFGSDDRIVDTVASSVGSSAQRDTEQVLGRCKDDLSTTFSQLNDRLEEISRRQHSLVLQHNGSDIPDYEEATLQEEIDSVKQGLLLCAEASRKAQPDRKNTFEDISVTDDGHQVIVSTFGDLVSARQIKAGARSVQLFGQMSDETLQQLSRRDGITSKKSL